MMKRIGAVLSENSNIVVFFLFLLVSLFLGDGKQPITDVIVIPVVGFLLLQVIVSRQKEQFPRFVNVLWGTTILYYVVRTAVSDSIGFSLTSTVRIIEAYMLYLVFYEIASKGSISRFVHGVVALAAISTGASFVFIVFPELSRQLPDMNLLYATYGHNHAVALVLFALPIAVAHAIPRTRWYWFAILLLLSLGALLSFARGAYIVLIVYFFLQYMIGSRAVAGRNRWLFGFLSALFLGSLVTISLVSRAHVSRQLSVFPSWLTRQLVKPQTIEDSRIHYWIQAVRAIEDRPLFGSGPGTFYVLSKRFQSTPLSYSWFAHSFPLQTIAELGIVGALPVYLLLAVLAWNFWNTLKNHRHESDRTLRICWVPLLWGVALSFVYSFYEFNLDFVVVWFLFWASLGMLSGLFVQTSAHRARHTSALSIGGLGLLVVYYVLSLGSLTAHAVTHDSQLAFLIAPFDTDRAISYLSWLSDHKQPIDGPQALLVTLFHRRNPEVAAAQAHVADEVGDYVYAKDLYEQANLSDPQNVGYYADYIAFLLRTNNRSQINAALGQETERILPQTNRDVLRQVHFSSDQLISLYTKTLLEDIGRPTTIQEYLSKAYYFLGLKLLPHDPLTTRLLWTRARDLSPGWGYFHVELASLEYTVFHQQEEAERILLACQNYPPAAEECAALNSTTLGPPGNLKESVRAIPLVLNNERP